jgi:hypothetical protein
LKLREQFARDRRNVLTKPLYGRQPIPVLMALRIVASHYLEIMKDPQDTLRRLVVDLDGRSTHRLSELPLGDSPSFVSLTGPSRTLVDEKSAIAIDLLIL